MKSSPFIVILVLSISLLALPALLAAEEAVSPAMIGHWEGSADIIVIWCHQRQLPVSLDLHPDGTIEGRVGDARLAQGRFTRNRGWLGRKLNLATDYIVKGQLEGPVVAAEGISRASVSMPLRFDAGRFTGGLHTSGDKTGGPDRMILSAAHLHLTKSP